MGNFTEADIKTKFILPAIKKAGWDVYTQVREEVYFTKGRVIVRGKMAARGTSKKADYILYYKPNIPLAIIEAKDESHHLGDGMQQALTYAEILDIPFVFTSNGTGFRFHDKTGLSPALEQDLPLDCLPSPTELWKRYKTYKGLESIVSLPPLAEQHRIVAKVDELMTLCDQLEAQLTTTQTLNAALMDALLHHLCEGAENTLNNKEAV